jgi:hypothetical protein
VATFVLSHEALPKPVPITHSLLLPGLDRNQDIGALAEFDLTLGRAFEGMGVPWEGDLVTVTERPVIISVIFPGGGLAPPATIMMVADMETCLAAAFFDLAANAPRRRTTRNCGSDPGGRGRGGRSPLRRNE